MANLKLVYLWFLQIMFRILDFFLSYLFPNHQKFSALPTPSIRFIFGNCEEELPKKPVGRQLTDSRPTVDRQSADRFFGELFFTITSFFTILLFTSTKHKFLHQVRFLFYPPFCVLQGECSSTLFISYLILE